MLDIALGGKVLVIVGVVWAYFSEFGAHQRKPKWWYGDVEQYVLGFKGERKNAWTLRMLAIGWFLARGCQAAGIAIWWLLYWPQDTAAKVPLNVWYWVMAAALGDLAFAWGWAQLVWMWTNSEQDAEDKARVARTTSSSEYFFAKMRVGWGIPLILLSAGCCILVVTLTAVQEVWLPMGLFCPAIIMYTIAMVLSIRTVYYLVVNETPSASRRPLL